MGLQIFGFVLFCCGMSLAVYWYGWELALVLFLLLWSSNIDTLTFQRLKRGVTN